MAGRFKGETESVPGQAGKGGIFSRVWTEWISPQLNDQLLLVAMLLEGIIISEENFKSLREATSSHQTILYEREEPIVL